MMVSIGSTNVNDDDPNFGVMNPVIFSMEKFEETLIEDLGPDIVNAVKASIESV